MTERRGEYIPVGAVIESDASYYRRAAIRAHNTWLADPGSLSKKREYGFALEDWAKAARNAEARRYARQLIQETAC